MSDVNFNCPHCGQLLEAPAALRGSTINCPACDGSIEMPDAKPERVALKANIVNARPSIPAPNFSYTKNPQLLTSFLVAMLWISFGVLIVSILCDFGQISLLGTNFTDAQAEANDTRQALVGIGHIAISIVTGITFLIWIYRANLNCHGFGAENMRFSPGWSVGYYFIPIINLFRPYQSMKEIWQVSQNPQNWESQETGAFLGWWWTLWILSNTLGRAASLSWRNAHTLAEFQISTMLSIVSSSVGIGLCLLAMQLVKGIAHNQQKLVTNCFSFSSRA